MPDLSLTEIAEELERESVSDYPALAKSFAKLPFDARVDLESRFATAVQVLKEYLIRTEFWRVPNSGRRVYGAQCDKVSYESKNRACRAAQNVSLARDRRKLYPYKCEVCKKWHLTKEG